MARGILNEIRTFSKAESSALIATCVDYAVLFLCDKFLEFDFYLATFIGSMSGGIVNCMLNYRFVFYSSGLKKLVVARRYLIIWAGNIVLNFFGTLLFKGGLHMKAYYARIVASVLVAIGWNYGMQRLFVFKQKGKSK